MKEKLKDEILELLEKITDLIKKLKDFIEETELEELSMVELTNFFLRINSLFHALNQVEAKIKEIQRTFGIELISKGLSKLFGEDIDIH